MRVIRQIAKEAFIKFFIGSVAIWWLYDTTGYLKIFTVIAILFTLYYFIKIVTISQDLIDDIFPIKTLKGEKGDVYDRMIYYISMTFFFGGSLIEIIEIDKIDNTINGINLFWTYAAIGLIIAAIFVFILQKIKPTVFDESDRRYSIVFGLFIGLFLLIPAFASILNRKLSGPQMICEKYEVTRKGTDNDKSAHYLFISFSSGNERIVTNHNFWSQINESDIIEICTTEGWLGYKYINQINQL